MSTRHALLKLLADGAFHSGTILGERLGVSRAAVNKAVQTLAENGFDIHRVSGRGYRLDEPLVVLSADSIRDALHARGWPLPVEVLAETDSTSQHLLRTMAPDLPNGRVCLAEAQSAGRGRRGRGWVATPFHNIVMSMAWRYDSGPAAMAGLSLAAGVAVLRALDEFGARDTGTSLCGGRSQHPASRDTGTSLCGAGLKWPNDILLDGRKLAGLLVDLRGEAAGPSLVVLGLGLNVRLAPADAAAIDQPWAALRERLPAPVDRNRLATLLIAHLADMFRVFETGGFDAFRHEWERRHLYQRQSVCLHGAHEQVTGTVVGVDAHGGLRLRDERGVERTFHSGDVSLRAADGAAS